MEDEFGTANMVVYSQIAARDRSALIGGRMLIAEGREDQQAAVPIVHLIVQRLTDGSELLDGLGADQSDAEGFDRALEAVSKRVRDELGWAGWPGLIVIRPGCDTLDERRDVDPGHPAAA